EDGGGAGDVAEQGDLAEVVARAHGGDRAAVLADVDLAGGQDVEAVAVLALADDGGAGRGPDRGHGGGHPLGHLGGQGGEHRDRPEQNELGGVERGGDLGRGQAAPDQQRAGQHQPAGGDQGAADPEQGDGGRHQHRAEADGGHAQALEDAEDPAEDLVGGAALEQEAARDLGDDASGAGHGQQERHRRPGRDQGDGAEGQAPA